VSPRPASLISIKARPRANTAPAHAGANLLVHDLKGMACRLGLLLQNLDERYEDPLFKATVLDVLDGTIGQLKRLACDLRDHDSRLLVKLRLDLNQILEESLITTRPDLCGTANLVESYADIPMIWGDAFLLRCAFACAIDNALEAMNGKGTLRASTVLSRRNGHKKITIEIADDGPGMSAEFMRRHLFAPFSTTKEDGMGMGAYTIRQVAALHGGTVRILSKEGQGTRVRFHFPGGDG